ncbi:excinuclease ABC subunit UvrA [Candidatus Gottesmanbacteria bacterium]|nr:excinuclease ABC subunit UvrA [Candidatus Gottesmanbacteria bacterium]
MQNKIIIRGARQHNLKNINLEIPKNELVVFTGISGSGKSSLAFDTIYAEGQRRYVESLSSYARQFLGIMDKPDVESIEGLSPAISIDQKSTSHNPRSTVGTITEIYDYLRLLFARIGNPHCSNCQRLITRQSSSQIIDNVINLVQNIFTQKINRYTKIIILSPLIRDKKGEFNELFLNLKSKGFSRVRIDGKYFFLNEDFNLIRTNKHNIEVVVDRISFESTVFKKDINSYRSRLSEAVDSSLGLSQGLCIVSYIEDKGFDIPENPKIFSDHLYSERFACPHCNISLPEIEPRLFSFNSPHGACINCSGIGKVTKVNPSLVLSKNLSISEGGILPFARSVLSDTWYGRLILTVARNLGINPTQRLREVNNDILHKLLFGTGDTVYEIEGQNRQGKMVTIQEVFSGVVPELEKRFKETDSPYVRTEINRFMQEEICSKCLGKRLKPEALSITLDNFSIIDITALSISDSLSWIQNLYKNLSERDKLIASLIVKEISNRLQFLTSVGLEYLALDRAAGSLAGGEAQRIRLASQIGSGLSGVLYVLDEPSIGLHPRDNDRLIASLKKLRDLGNTLVVVEHDKDMMRNADYIVDFGPGAGEHGGKVISEGTYQHIIKDPKSITGQYLSGRKKIILRNLNDNKIINKQLTVFGCSENNLKNININIPIGRLVCITGVSGSGKSTLIVDTLYQLLAKYFNPYHKEKIGKYEKVTGLEYLKRVILIDQSPIGRTPRSNPATYTGIFTPIRELFAMTIEARTKGYRPGRFSFNVKGGRCEVCQGEGVIKIEMQFLPDVYVTCDTCHGTRYNLETLDIRYKGKSISDVLKMTVEDAEKFFNHHPILITKLETLHHVGLSYLKLGQPATQLSGGEAQRVKLATELSKKNTRDSIFILDEPTTGLHFADLEKLMFVLKDLVTLGNTVVVIEHNLDVIKNADWVVDLGPEGGDQGGNIIVAGNPRDIAANKNSYTGHFLKKALN